MIERDNELANLDLEELLALTDEESVAALTDPGGDNHQAVAVIGMAGRVGGCRDLEAFWELLRQGRTGLRRLPESRQGDLEEFLNLKGASHVTPDLFLRETFLDGVDLFDHRFFGISRQEAAFIDPNQRLFLETAWAALENAGYGGDGVRGTTTGVFVGFSSDFGEDYRRIIHTHAPDAPEVAVAGNIRSIIASRISYHLDLRGPSLMVDTACSSGLVAVHLALRSLRNGDCEMALAGGVKLDLIPVAEDSEAGIGIKDIQDTIAHDGLTRTFDDQGAGTSAAEGVLAFLLKPLDRALADGDTIHGVILGSAINQDGLSVGITAPNAAAQEQLIVRALEDARVEADSLSYLEAHGTATRLGDPIEIAGIQRALGRFTHRRQFCAVGSVKTNIGHMDNAAGLAGLAKVLLSLRHRQLPPSLHFSRPNRNIAFERAPVYVNDLLRPWTGPTPRRAGINSFGLSGTNCHVVVEEAPARSSRSQRPRGPFVLPLSAGSDAALVQLVEAYLARLKAEPAPDPADLAFTAAVGRLHHGHRLAVAFDDLDQLRRRLEQFLEEGQDGLGEGMTYGRFRRVEGDRPAQRETDLTDSRRRRLDQQAGELAGQFATAEPDQRPALVDRALDLYAQGADLPWSRWWTGQPVGRIPLPTYPFARTRCWVETTPAAQRLAGRRHRAKQIAHPLLDRCVVHTLGLAIYQSVLGVESHWELGDHRVQGVCILPGTAYVEMILEVAGQLGLGAGTATSLVVEQLMFASPLVVQDREPREIDLVASQEGERWRVRIISHSRPDTDHWEVHAEGWLKAGGRILPLPVDLAALEERLPEAIGFERQDDTARGLEIGERWNGAFVAGRRSADSDEFLVRLRLPDTYRRESRLYHYHPALLDTALNAVNHLLGEGDLYLPLAYKHLEVFDRLPVEVCVHLRRKPAPGQETFCFDIDLLDEDGMLRAALVDYTIKRVPQVAPLEPAAGGESRIHHLALVPRPAPVADIQPPQAPVLVVDCPGPRREAITAALSDQGITPLTLDWAGDEGNDAEGLKQLVGQSLAGVIYAAGWPQDEPRFGLPGASVELHDLFDFIRGFVAARLRSDGPVLVLSQGAFAADHQPVQPTEAALAGLARVAALEYPQLKVRSLDCDRLPDGELLARELADDREPDLAIYRQGRRYGERLESVTDLARRSFQPRAEGVYLFTGGTGALSLEVAHWLAGRGPVNLALVSATPLPERDEWEKLLESGSGERRTLERIRRVMALEALGARVETIAADVADQFRMADVLAGLRNSYGRINGVLHAAGRAGAGYLVTKDRHRFEGVLRPKIDGARVLHTLTLEDRLEFFLMFSSIATVLRNPGQADYTAANAYLDALAHYRRSQGLPALAVLWPAWREVGIAVEYGAVDEAEFFAPIDNADALELLEAALANGNALPPAVVLAAINPQAGTGQLDALNVEMAEDIRSRFKGHRPARSPRPVEADVVLNGLEEPDDIDRTVARLWGRILGATELEADDIFTDLGGNSLLTTQLYREFETVYPGAVEVADLFTHTTVRDQAAYIRRTLKRDEPPVATPVPPPAEAPATAPASAETDMDRVLAMLASGELSPEEAQDLLAN